MGQMNMVEAARNGDVEVIAARAAVGDDVNQGGDGRCCSCNNPAPSIPHPHGQPTIPPLLTRDYQLDAALNSCK